MSAIRHKTAAAIVNLENVRLSFPQVFEPHAYEDGDEPAFSCRLIFDAKTPAGQRKALRKTMNDLSMQAFGKPLDSFTHKEPEKRIPLRDGSEIVDQNTGRPIDGYGEGTWFVSCRSNKDKPPFVGKLVDGDAVETTPKEGLIYGGGRVHAKLRIYSYEHPKNGRRLCAQLKAIIFAGHDTPFGDKKVTAEDLEDMKHFKVESTLPKAKNRRVEEDEE